MKYKTELSRRQQQVYELIRLGLPAREIANRLGITTGAVSSHKQAIFNKKTIYSVREIQADVKIDILPEGLSRCQKLILQAITQGKSNRTISEEMVVSERTVQAHVRRLYKKLNVNCRYQAIERVLALKEATLT